MIGFSVKSQNKPSVFRTFMSYGVMASTPEIDTMSASIALANYFSSVKGLRTVIAVAGTDLSVAHMLRDMSCIDIEPTGYSDTVMSYYIVDSPDDMEAVRGKGYDRVVADLGSDYSRYDTTMLMGLDHIRALVSTHAWRYHSAREFLFSTIVKEKGLRQRFGNKVFSAAGTSGSDKRLADEFAIATVDARALSDVRDPYRITKKDFSSIQILV